MTRKRGKEKTVGKGGMLENKKGKKQCNEINERKRLYQNAWCVVDPLVRW